MKITLENYEEVANSDVLFMQWVKSIEDKGNCIRDYHDSVSFRDNESDMFGTDFDDIFFSFRGDYALIKNHLIDKHKSGIWQIQTCDNENKVNYNYYDEFVMLSTKLLPEVYNTMVIASRICILKRLSILHEWSQQRIAKRDKTLDVITMTTQESIRQEEECKEVYNTIKKKNGWFKVGYHV